MGRLDPTTPSNPPSTNRWLAPLANTTRPVVAIEVDGSSLGGLLSRIGPSGLHFSRCRNAMHLFRGHSSFLHATITLPDLSSK